MQLDNIPDPILKDMLATLQGDAPILYKSWYKKAMPIYDIPPCGCLMMDNHVEEYIDNLMLEEGESVASLFLAEVYNKKLARSSNYRGYFVTSGNIDSYARQFDGWCDDPNKYFTDPKDGIEYLKIHTLIWQVEGGSQVIADSVLTDEARVYLAGLIKATLRERRKDPSLHDYVRSTLLAREKAGA